MNRSVCPLRFDKACPGERIALERTAIHKLAASAKVSAVEKVWDDIKLCHWVPKGSIFLKIDQNQLSFLFGFYLKIRERK